MIRLMDLRYLVDAAEGFFEESNQEFKHVQRQEDLLQKLNATQDWTAFYRNSAKAELDEFIKPVSRYRH